MFHGGNGTNTVTLTQTARKRIVGHPAGEVIEPPVMAKKPSFDKPADAKQPSAYSMPVDSGSGTKLDRILNTLRTRKWPKDIALVITPATHDINEYTVHIIDPMQSEHLGVLSITRGELSEIQASKAYDRYTIIFGTKCMDMRTAALQSTHIGEFMESLNVNGGGGGGLKQIMSGRTGSLRASSSDTTDTFETTSESDRLPYKIDVIDVEQRRVELQREQQNEQAHAMLLAKLQLQQQQQQQAQELIMTTHQQIQKQKCSDCKLNNISVTDVRLRSLIDRINSSFEPSTKDLDKFFTLAEDYNFKMFLRPELYWRTTIKAPDVEGDDNLARFIIECYMHCDNYVGSITLYSAQLHLWLHKHIPLLSRITVINDVSELTPVPRWFINAIRTILKGLGLDIIYDTITELMFSFYKGSVEQSSDIVNM